MTSGLTWEEFDGLFQRFADSDTSASVFRWEMHQRYEIPDDEPSLVAFRNGTPRPERSVRTSPWLARIATSTASGKSWQRIRAVVEPLSEYVEWELIAYVESQAVGEQVRVLRTASSVTGPEDFWLFDGAAPQDCFAIVMHYDEQGRPVELEHVTDAAQLRVFLTRAGDLRNEDSLSLNEYLAVLAEVDGAA